MENRSDSSIVSGRITLLLVGYSNTFQHGLKFSFGCFDTEWLLFPKNQQNSMIKPNTEGRIPTVN